MSPSCVECDAPAKIKGRCKPHYQRQWRLRPPTGSPCRRPGCPRRAALRATWGYCDVHQERFRNNRPMDKPIRTHNKRPPSCRGPECLKLTLARGYCSAHYAQWRTGMPLKPISKKRSVFDEPCSYGMAHDRPKRIWGAAKHHRCIQCGDPAKEWAYDGTDPSQIYGPNAGNTSSAHSYYSRFPEFYMPMCHACHRKRDITAAFLELQEYREWKWETGLTLSDYIFLKTEADNDRF